MGRGRLCDTLLCISAPHSLEAPPLHGWPIAGSTLVGGSRFVPDTSVLGGMLDRAGGGGDSAHQVACPVVIFHRSRPPPGTSVSHKFTNVHLYCAHIVIFKCCSNFLCVCHWSKFMGCLLYRLLCRLSSFFCLSVLPGVCLCRPFPLSPIVQA